MNTRLALLILAAAAAFAFILFIAYDTPHCDRTSAPGPKVGDVLMIWGCR